MSEKCFCHIKDKKTGEIFVVKDREARTQIESVKTRIDNLENKSLSFITDSSVAYSKNVPVNTLPYAFISRIDESVTAVKSKSPNILDTSGIGNSWQVDCVIQSDGCISFTRTGNGGVAFFNTYVITLEAGKTYTLRNDGIVWEFVQLFKKNGDSVVTTFYGKTTYTPTQTENYYLRVYMSNSMTSIGDTGLVKLWINEGDINLPFTPNVTHTLTPTEINSGNNFIKVYGCGTLIFENESNSDVYSEVVYQLEGVE